MPNPDTAWWGQEYTEQLVLIEGQPAPVWSLLQGPSGARINSSTGLVSGWSPQYDDIGALLDFQCRAVNSGGADTVSWQVRVKARGDLDLDGDSDQEDFALMQLCLSGTGLGYPPGCADSDFDGDYDVELNDIDRFLNCMTGPNQPVQVNCGN